MAKTTRVGKSLIEIQKELGTEEQCIAFLKGLRWPDGVRCVSCGRDRISEFQVAESSRKRVNAKGETEIKVVPARHLFQCLSAECGHQFSVTAGTIFNDSHLPLQKWMLAVALMCNAKKGISAKQIQRDIGVTYKTAWFLNHRIREAMMLGNWTDEKMTGTVEIDETYVGGKYDKRLKRAKYDKPAVFGMKERESGKVYARHIQHVNQWGVGQHIDTVASKEAKLRSDESKLYLNLTRKGYDHGIVIHSDKEWVRGDVHTQGIDSFWGLVKRGVIGSFHQVSIKHLDRYIQEFTYRNNNRGNQELFTVTVAALALGSPLPYDKLAGPEDTRIVRNRKGVNA
jgi:hypothetical protein